MSAKGKERAVIVIDDDDLSDDAFFTAPKPRARKLASVSIEIPSSDSYSGESDEEGNKKKRTKKGKAKAKKVVEEMPEWARPKARNKRNVERASTESRARTGSSQSQPHIVDLVDDDDDDVQILPGRGKEAKAKSEMQPPPEPTEEQKKRTRETTEAYLASLLNRNRVDEPPEDPPSPQGRPVEETITIRILMRSDPAKVQDGTSAKAVEVWEKIRTFQCSRTSALNVLLEDLAKLVSRAASDLILVHNGHRLSTSVSPAALGFRDLVVFDGWEKAVWTRMEEEKQAAWTRRMNGELDEEDQQPSPNYTGDGAAPAASKEPASTDPNATAHQNGAAPRPKEAPAGTIPITCHGEWGNTKIAVKPIHTVKQLIEYYCRKFGKTAEASRVRILFDGDIQDLTTTVEDMELEAGYQVDFQVV